LFTRARAAACRKVPAGLTAPTPTLFDMVRSAPFPAAALAAAAIAAVAAAPRPAAADRLSGLHLEGWYGKVGLESGVVFARERGAAPLLGGTVTFVRLNRHLEWYGLQADLLADWNGDRDAGARWSAGPELGRSLFGVDISYFGERVGGETHHGFQVRAKLTAGLAALYVRGAYALSRTDETSLEVGLQVKLPVFIARNRRSQRSDAPRAAHRE
jgi:hypothetical protein